MTAPLFETPAPGAPVPGAGPHVPHRVASSGGTDGAVAGSETVTAPALVIEVYGTPAPQGSKRHVGNGVMIESSKKVKPWREAVKWAALESMSHVGPLGPRLSAMFASPVVVSAVFTFARPKGHFRTGRNSEWVRESAPLFPAGRPDLDKLLRSTLDALGEAAVFRDDAQVVSIRAAKVYVGEDLYALDRPGAVIRVVAL